MLSRLESEGSLARCEKLWEELIASSPCVKDLTEYNRFRLRNLPRLERIRPAVLLGPINNFCFPNFHTLELLKVADVVSLSTLWMNSTPSPDRLYYVWETERFPSLLGRLPEGFKPNLYWDSQAANAHIHPLGLEGAPFPTVAGVCHVQQVQACKYLSMLFDFVAPVGRAFDSYFSANGRAEVLQLPFGLNWASLNDSLIPEVSRDIDVSLTFSSDDCPVYAGRREEVFALVEEFRDKWKEKFRVEIANELDQQEYRKLLKRSLISINVVGVNGPYNYRTCEIMSSGTLLFQLDTRLNPVPSDDEELFVEGEHFIRFRPDNLEQLLLHYLDNPQKIARIAFGAKEFLRGEYSYENLYRELLSEIAERWNPGSRDLSSDAGDYLLGCSMWNQAKINDFPFLGVGLIFPFLTFQEELMIRSNLLATLPEALHVFERNTLSKFLRLKDPGNLKFLESCESFELADFLFRTNPEHPGLIWNYLALAAEKEWLPREKLAQLCKEELLDVEWPFYDSCFWLLRQNAKPHWMSVKDFETHQFKYLQVPLLSNLNGPGAEWGIYRDFLVRMLE